MKCVVCGKEFEGDVRRRYCSPECKHVMDVKNSLKSLHRKYHSDEDYRKKRIADNSAGNKRRREARREQAMQKVVAELVQAKTAEEIRSILEENTRLKSTLYA